MTWCIIIGWRKTLVLCELRTEFKLNVETAKTRKERKKERKREKRRRRRRRRRRRKRNGDASSTVELGRAAWAARPGSRGLLSDMGLYIFLSLI